MPIPALSGRRDRHRLNRGGDCAANHVLHNMPRTPSPCPVGGLGVGGTGVGRAPASCDGRGKTFPTAALRAPDRGSRQRRSFKLFPTSARVSGFP
ncbi:hypothetical protein [Yinghuangia sp. YIM S10712]|uniref:hypothetical protein n=1 Tax=Yinghuangia sp. YIM S10712 TaxID=3436930 RepID=UPI003F529EBA